MGGKQVVVVGLGRFGSSLAVTLAQLGHEVLGLDTKMAAVQEVSEQITRAVQVDATDEDTLRELGVGEFDMGAVAIATDIKSSVMITMLLKRLGVKMVIAKAQDQLHADILAKLGADRVVFPERETAIRVAHGMSAPDLLDYMEVTSGYGVAKVVIPASFEGKRLDQIDLKKRFGLTTLMLYCGEELVINPPGSQMLDSGDVLVITGRDDQIESFRGL